MSFTKKDYFKKVNFLKLLKSNNTLKKGSNK